MAIRSAQVFNIEPADPLVQFFQKNPPVARRDAALAKLSRMKPGTMWAIAHAPFFDSPYDEDDDPREFLTGIARAVATRTHVQHPWAGGWKCWVCPMWSPAHLTGNVDRQPK
jgi:hypothetical protein